MLLFQTHLSRYVAVAAAVTASAHKRYDKRVFTKRELWNNSFFPKCICSDMLRLRLLPQRPTSGMLNEFLQNNRYETTVFQTSVSDLLRLLLLPQHPTVCMLTKFFSKRRLGNNLFFLSNAFYQICCGPHSRRGRVSTSIKRTHLHVSDLATPRRWSSCSLRY